MDLRTGVQLDNRTQVTVTGRLLQSLHLLQTPGIELVKALREEINRNPFLEEVVGAEEEGIDPGSSDESVAPVEHSANDDHAETLDSERDQSNLEQIKGLSARGEVIRKSGERNPDLLWTQQLEAKEPWQIRLLRQLGLQEISEIQLAIAEYLLWCLDERGFLRESLKEIAKATGSSRMQVEEVRQSLMILDPPGFGATSIKECLQVQLRLNSADDSLALQIVEVGLDDLARHRWAKLARQVKASPASVKAAASRIRRLWPYPKQRVTAGGIESVYPDLMVDQVGDGFEVSVNDWRLPSVRFSPPGQSILCRRDETLQAFVTEYVGKARWLLGSLDARRRTLIRLMRVIVDEQWDLFTKGVRFLKPLGYRHVADRLGFHESTIARAVQDKYVQTPRGVFPLRFFFTKALPAASGSPWTAVGVKMRITELIGGENSHHPLSDDDLTLALAREGIVISRRTVAKYRDGLRLPKASLRKE